MNPTSGNHTPGTRSYSDLVDDWAYSSCLHQLAHTQVSFKGCPYKSTSCDECLQTFPAIFLLPCINANRRTKDCVGPGMRLMHSWSCWVHVLLENELNSIWTLKIELFVMFYLSNDGRQKIKALITPPSRWVSAPNSYVWVSTREQSRWYSQYLCRLLSSQALLYLHYITLRGTIFSIPGVYKFLVMYKGEALMTLSQNSLGILTA